MLIKVRVCLFLTGFLTVFIFHLLLAQKKSGKESAELKSDILQTRLPSEGHQF